MKKQLVSTLIVIIFPFLFASCISGILKEKPPVFSNQIKYVEPNAPFKSQTTSVFPSWKSRSTGNVIALVSDCDPNSDVSLQQMHSLLEDSMNNFQIQNEKTVQFQERPAHYKNTTGHLDEVPIEVRALSFKRKSCTYLSYLSGKKGGLDADQQAWENFNLKLSFE